MKVNFVTLGCKVNQYETQAIAEKFAKAGYTITDGDADIYLINSCSVTASADRKVRELVRKFKARTDVKVIVCGCMAELNGDVLKDMGVDIVIPQNMKANVFELVTGRELSNDSIWSLGISEFPNRRAFIKVQDGCDNYCSFCKIPYLRGKPTSRPREDVLAEVRRLSLNHPEIILTGVNLTMYGRGFADGYGLYELVSDIAAIPSLGRVRLSSVEPIFVDEKLLSVFRDTKVCPHLHLPFQTADNRVLKAMNKRETVELYRDIVCNARGIEADIAISCDIIVGFPDETDESFNNTVSFLSEIKPMRTHIFSFSARDNTKFFHNVSLPKAIVKRRYEIIKSLAGKWALEYYNKFLGRKVYMVTEEQNNGYVYGYTEHYIRVAVKGYIPIGVILPVTITSITNELVEAEYEN